MESYDESSVGSTFSEAARKRTNTVQDTSESDDGVEHVDSGTDASDVGNRKIRTLVAFWFFGLCNNFGYVVMLSAAYDILEKTETTADINNQTSHDIIPVNPALYNLTNTTDLNPYKCKIISTGTILLADILPTLGIKVTAPWFADRIHYDIRVAFCILSGVGSFLFVALAHDVGLIIMGVLLASVTTGLGEFTFLSSTTFYNKNVVSTYSSGTGAAGIFGSLLYAGLIAVGLSSRNTLLIMIIIPVLEGISYWCILTEKPTSSSTCIRSTPEDVHPLLDLRSTQLDKLTYQEKIKAITPLLKYIIPLVLVYYAEYTINQGLFDLIYFPGIWLSHSDQYRWYQVIYQLSVFISRSSVNIVSFKHIWIFAVLQFVNLAFLMCESVLHFLPSIWIMFAVVFFEGLFGGGAFVNSFYQISKEVSVKDKEFSMGVTTVGDAIGITLAALLSIPIHNVICKYADDYI